MIASVAEISSAMKLQVTDRSGIVPAGIEKSLMVWRMASATVTFVYFLVMRDLAR